MGSYNDLFGTVDTALVSALGDDAQLDVLGDGSNVQPVRGQFDAPWTRPRLGQIRTELTEPQFVAPSSVLAAAEEGVSVLIVGAERYEVVYAEPDSSGMTTLVLKPL